MNNRLGLDRALAERILFGTEDEIPVLELSRVFSVAPAEIRRALNQLCRLGYPFVLRRDFVQRGPFGLLDAQRLGAKLNPWRIGRRIEWRLHVSSTQEELKRIAQTSEDGTVLIAESQGLGRGRRSRNWFSPFGGVWMSVLLKPTWPNFQILTLAFGTAVARAISSVGRLSPVLKWPNDVMVRSRKVAGILAEATYEGAKLNTFIVGIGINVNITVALFPKALRGSATSISHELHREVDRTLLTQMILEEMDKSYHRFESGHATELREDAKRMCSTLGRKVRVTTVEGVLEGWALDLGNDGQLLLRLENGAEVQLFAGDVVHLR